MNTLLDVKKKRESSRSHTNTLTIKNPSIMPAKDLLDVSDDELTFTINDKFAKRYEEKKKNEELTFRECS